MQSFAITLTAPACPCPITGAPLPALAAAYTVQATDRASALKAARREMPVRPMGQVVYFLIDGTKPY